MICARCAQPIEKGQLYQEARRFKYTESESMQSGHVDPGVWVHDSPCPNAPDTGGDSRRHQIECDRRPIQDITRASLSGRPSLPSVRRSSQR